MLGAVSTYSRFPRTAPVHRTAGHPGERTPLVDDALITSQFLGAGKVYELGFEAAQELAKVSPPLHDVSPVNLERPLLILPGWTTEPSKFDHLVAKLTEDGRNGGKAYFVKDGEVYDDPECSQRVEQLDPQAKIFIAVYHHVLQTPPETAPQIDRSIQELQQRGLTGKLDVIGYSLGGVAARKYLDNGGQDFGKVVLLGTSNHGARLATLAREVIERDLNWALSMSGITVAHLPAMKWMSEEGPEGRDNPDLYELNENWDRQKSQAEEVLIIGSDGIQTPTQGLWPMRGGDGLVARSSLEMPDTPIEVFPGKGYKHHGQLVHDSDVYHEMTEFFGWTP